MIKMLFIRSVWSIIPLLAIGGLVISGLAREERRYFECLNSNLPRGDKFPNMSFKAVEVERRIKWNEVLAMCSEGRILPFVNHR